MARNWVITFWWALPNLIVPLLAIPVVMVIQWMSRKRPSWQAVIEDGQVCSIASRYSHLLGMT
jgi:hypothetical protein